MKKFSILCALALLTSINGFAQSFLDAYEATRLYLPFSNVNGTYNEGASGPGFMQGNTFMSDLTGNENEWSKIMGVLGEFDDITLGQKGIDGSVMFFDNEKKGRLYVSGKVYSVDKINYNIKTNQFQSRLKNDSIFIYHLEGLKRVVVNNTNFAIMYNQVQGKEKIYEVIKSGTKITLVKDHTIKHRKASPNPMVNRKNDKFIKKWKYYTVDNQDRIMPFKAKKKFLLGMIKDKGKKQKLEDYLSENKLSLKKEKDLKKIFQYLNSI